MMCWDACVQKFIVVFVQDPSRAEACREGGSHLLCLHSAVRCSMFMTSAWCRDHIHQQLRFKSDSAPCIHRHEVL